MEADVESALSLLLAEGKTVTADAVKALVAATPASEVPDLSPSAVDLNAYDRLLVELGT